MNEFYEHPLVMEIIRDYQSISMSINCNQSKIKTYLKKFELIFEQYKKYLINTLKKNFKLNGLPIKIIFKKADNPYD